MGYNPGYHKVGLGAWRAVLITQILKEIPTGDIVFFHDANYKKPPAILNILSRNVKDYVESIQVN